MHRLRVFISSVMSEMAYEREEAQRVVREMAAVPSLFELLPAMSDSPRTAYTEEVRECDLFVLLVGSRLSPPVLTELAEAEALNTPVIVLVRSSAGPREPSAASLLASLRDDAGPAPGPRHLYREYRTLDEFRSALRESLGAEVARLLRQPVQSRSRPEMYAMGADIVRFAQRRLAIVERTPSLLLGARPFDDAGAPRWAHEHDFAVGVDRWIERAAADPARRALYAFSVPDTRRLLSECAPGVRDRLTAGLAARLRRFQDLERASGLRVRVAPLDTVFSGPMAVGDNRFALWLLGGDDAVSILHENRQIADVVFRMLDAHVASRPPLGADDLHAQLVSGASSQAPH